MKKEERKELVNEKEINAIIEKIFGKDGAIYTEPRSFSKDNSVWKTFIVKIKSRSYPNECPDIQQLAAFVDECKKAFGEDCPQTKSYVWFSRIEDKYCIVWEVEEHE